MNFPGGATSLESFLKAYRKSESKRFFPYEWFHHPDKMQNLELPPYDAFYSKLRSGNPLETEYTDYANLLKSGLTTEQAVIKLKLSKPPPTGIEKYHYLQLMQNFIPSLREIMTYWKIFEKTSLVDHLSFLHAKQLLMKLLSENLKTYANLLLELMRANYTPTRCANPCPPVIIRVGISIQKPVDSHLDKTKPVTLNI